MPPHFFRRNVILMVVACLWPGAAGAAAAPRAFRAGAYAVDVTPETFPVIVNGGFTAVVAEQAHDRLFARWLVMEDAGGTRVGLCVVDSCMMPRELIERAKAEIEKATGLTPGRVMISATHTHSAPATMGCMGTHGDPH